MILNPSRLHVYYMRHCAVWFMFMLTLQGHKAGMHPIELSSIHIKRQGRHQHRQQSTEPALPCPPSGRARSCFLHSQGVSRPRSLLCHAGQWSRLRQCQHPCKHIISHSCCSVEPYTKTENRSTNAVKHPTSYILKERMTHWGMVCPLHQHDPTTSGYLVGG